MLLRQEEDYVEMSSSVEDTISMGVSNPALIFQMLCNRIYQFPLRTLVQEYMANARDAHREAGCDNRPVRVVLPNTFNNTLSIQDYGPGISPSAMANVFACIGESTKRGDNIQHGGWGIGAKVGFAYSDTFYITSRYGGTSTEYMAYLGPDRLGYIDKLSSRPYKADEGDGVTIKVPIQTSDYTDVAIALVRCTYFWSVRPTVVNMPSSMAGFFDRMPPCTDTYSRVFSLAGSDAKILHEQVIGGSIMPIIVVDGMLYGTISEERLPEVSKKLLPNSVIYMGVGELDLSISREGVQYTERTINAIHELVNAGSKADSTTVVDEFMRLVDPTSLRQTVDNVSKFTDGSSTSVISSKVTTEIWWGNFYLRYSPGSRWTGGLLRLVIPPGWAAYKTSSGDIKYGWGDPFQLRGSTVGLDRDTRIIVDDRPTQGTSRIMLKRVVDDENALYSGNYVILKPTASRLLHSHPSVIRGIWAELVDAVDGVFLGDYDKMRKKSDKKTKGVKQKACVFTTRSGKSRSQSVNPSTIDTLFRSLIKGFTIVVAYKGRAHHRIIDEYIDEGKKSGRYDIALFLVNDRAVLEWLLTESPKIMSLEKFRNMNRANQLNTNYELVKEFAAMHVRMRQLEYQFGDKMNMRPSELYSSDACLTRADSPVLDLFDHSKILDPYMKGLFEYRRLAADAEKLYTRIEYLKGRGRKALLDIMVPTHRDYRPLYNFYVDSVYSLLQIVADRGVYGDELRKLAADELTFYMNEKYKRGAEDAN